MIDDLKRKVKEFESCQQNKDMKKEDMLFISNSPHKQIKLAFTKETKPNTTVNTK